MIHNQQIFHSTISHNEISTHFMISHDISWNITISFHDNSKYLMKCHDIAWFLMVSHGFSWYCLCHSKNIILCRINTNSCILIRSCNIEEMELNWWRQHWMWQKQQWPQHLCHIGQFENISNPIQYLWYFCKELWIESPHHRQVLDSGYLWWRVMSESMSNFALEH